MGIAIPILTVKYELSNGIDGGFSSTVIFDRDVDGGLSNSVYEGNIDGGDSSSF